MRKYCKTDKLKHLYLTHPFIRQEATLQLYRPPSGTVRHNFPVRLTPFVGRTAELTAITTLLDNPDCRLLSLIGPGGIGKTRLALESAELILDTFPDGA